MHAISTNVPCLRIKYNRLPLKHILIWYDSNNQHTNLVSDTQASPKRGKWIPGGQACVLVFRPAWPRRTTPAISKQQCQCLPCPWLGSGPFYHSDHRDTLTSCMSSRTEHVTPLQQAATQDGTFAGWCVRQPSAAAQVALTKPSPYS